MAQSTPQASTSQTQEYPVRMPKDKRKRYCLMNMGLGTEPNFMELNNSSTPVRMERENNLKEYKTANDIDTLPKFGAGSEYGREQKEEARRKKYGILRKKYNPEDQPWIVKIGTGKNVKKLKGVREGTVSENTSYYIFTQCGDGGFEAIPIEEWYTFTPVIKYNYLNAEEAEEEFERRDKQLNMFNIMLRRRYLGNAEDKDNDGDEEEKKAGKGKKKAKPSREFMLVEGDEFGEMSDDEDGDREEEEREEDEDKPKAKKGGKKDDAPKKKKNAKTNSDDEAVEESDEGDYDDREVDYMSDSSSSSESVVEDRDKDEKYEEKGVDEEEGLRKLIDSEEEEEEENKNQDQDAETKDEAKPSKAGSDSESSSSSSDSDSDIEKNVKLPAALLMSGGKADGKSKSDSKKSDKGGSKRKAESEASSSSSKKPKLDGRGDKRADTPSTSQAGASSSEGITEEAVRRYLTRKPMTIKDLLHKFKSKKLNITTEEMTHTIVRLLRKIAPERKLINRKLYLSLKKPE